MFALASWLWALTVKELGVKEILLFSKDLGLTDILVLTKSISGSTFTDTLNKIISNNDYGIRVHAWIVCFEDHKYSNGEVSPSNEKYRNYLLSFIAGILEKTNVEGIHLDYIRYKGNASGKWYNVSSFVREVRKIIDEKDPSIILSIASKAERYDTVEELKKSALCYGQNYEDLANYVDVFMPMTYYLDYNVEPEAAVRASKWIKEITGRKVYTGVQLHPSEHPETRGKHPSINDIEKQLVLSKRQGLDGVCFFRFKHLYERAKELKDIISKIKSL